MSLLAERSKPTTQFAYQGFTHEASQRCFWFQGGGDKISPAQTLCIAMDLALFADYHIALQEGPMFCLQLLTTASLVDGGYAAHFQRYQVLKEDLSPLLMERERRAAEKALRKTPRGAFRKPGLSSQFKGLAKA